jgi:C4-dicarboxylate transporter DctM subunit
MTGLETGAAAGVLMLGLMALRVHIAMAMLIAGVVGYIWMAGPAPLLSYMKTAAWARYSIYDLSVVPLFLLMGQFATHGGLSKALFRAGATLIGHWRGGMAMAAVGACAGFGAICGSSLATAATMGQVALPELRSHKYSGAPGHCRDRRRRHAGNPDPALGAAGDLCHSHRAEHRQAVHGRR